MSKPNEATPGIAVPLTVTAASATLGTQPMVITAGTDPKVVREWLTTLTEQTNTKETGPEVKNERTLSRWDLHTLTVCCDNYMNHTLTGTVTPSLLQVWSRDLLQLRFLEHPALANIDKDFGDNTKEVAKLRPTFQVLRSFIRAGLANQVSPILLASAVSGVCEKFGVPYEIRRQLANLEDLKGSDFHTAIGWCKNGFGEVKVATPTLKSEQVYTAVNPDGKSVSAKGKTLEEVFGAGEAVQITHPEELARHFQHYTPLAFVRLLTGAVTAGSVTKEWAVKAATFHRSLKKDNARLVNEIVRESGGSVFDEDDEMDDEEEEEDLDNDEGQYEDGEEGEEDLTDAERLEELVEEEAAGLFQSNRKEAALHVAERVELGAYDLMTAHRIMDRMKEMRESVDLTAKVLLEGGAEESAGRKSPAKDKENTKMEKTMSPGSMALEMFTQDAKDVALRTGVQQVRTLLTTKLVEFWAKRATTRQAGETDEAFHARAMASQEGMMAFLNSEAGKAILAYLVGFSWPFLEGHITNPDVRAYGALIAKEVRVSAGAEVINGFFAEVIMPLMGVMSDEAKKFADAGTMAALTAPMGGIRVDAAPAVSDKDAEIAALKAQLKAAQANGASHDHETNGVPARAAKTHRASS